MCLINNIQSVINGVNICVDYKVELIGILITLSDESSIEQFKILFEFNKNNDEYMRTIKNTFSYLKQNGFIDEFNKIKNKYYLHYQEPIELMLMLDENFNTDILEEFLGYKPEQDFYDFINNLKEFSRDPIFINFYNDNIDRYKSWIESLIPFYKKFNMSYILSKYCGEKYKNLKLYNNLIAFETSGGYGIDVDNNIHYCTRANSCRLTKDNLLFSSFDDESYLKLTAHEFLHGIVNPITEKFGVFTQESNYLIKLEKLNSCGYSTDESLINETIVRAITMRICSQFIKDYDINNLLNKLYDFGFIYIKEIYELMIEYENNREIYPNIDSIYEKIIKVVIMQKTSN